MLIFYLYIVGCAAMFTALHGEYEPNEMHLRMRVSLTILWPGVVAHLIMVLLLREVEK